MSTNHTQFTANAQASGEGFFRLSASIAQELRAADPPLTAAEWRLWSLLVTLDPYGKQYQELPDLVAILAECDMSKATFYRALAKFDDLGLFDTQPLRIAFRNLRGHEIVSKMRQESQICDDFLKNENSVSEMRIESQICDNQTPQTPEIRTNKQINKNLKETTEQHPPSRPVSPDIDSEGIGTNGQDPLADDVESLLDLVREAGINPNKTISQTVAQLLLQKGAAAARQIVRNAASAVAEQQKLGNVRNPGGMFVAALRRGFTSNVAKQEARGGGLTPIAKALTQPFIGWGFEQTIDQALMNGDREFVLGRLQSLQAAGEDLSDWLLLRKDWGFRIHGAAIEDTLTVIGMAAQLTPAD
jgi:AcrR family transcriptional regulator